MWKVYTTPVGIQFNLIFLHLYDFEGLDFHCMHFVWACFACLSVWRQVHSKCRVCYAFSLLMFILLNRFFHQFICEIKSSLDYQNHLNFCWISWFRINRYGTLRGQVHNSIFFIHHFWSCESEGLKMIRRVIITCE